MFLLSRNAHNSSLTQQELWGDILYFLWSAWRRKGK